MIDPHLPGPFEAALCVAKGEGPNIPGNVSSSHL